MDFWVRVLGVRFRVRDLVLGCGVWGAGVGVEGVESRVWSFRCDLHVGGFREGDDGREVTNQREGGRDGRMDGRGDGGGG